MINIEEYLPRHSKKLSIEDLREITLILSSIHNQCVKRAPSVPINVLAEDSAIFSRKESPYTALERLTKHIRMLSQAGLITSHPSGDYYLTMRGYEVFRE